MKKAKYIVSADSFNIDFSKQKWTTNGTKMGSKW